MKEQTHAIIIVRTAELTNGIVESTNGEKGLKIVSVKSKLSREDEVEAAADLEKRPSVWDKFDVTKISDAEFKLDFIAPELHDEYRHSEETYRKKKNPPLEKQAATEVGRKSQEVDIAKDSVPIGMNQEVQQIDTSMEQFTTNNQTVTHKVHCGKVERRTV
ncbi:hypothetical protein HAX54_014418 [Datura stramonium]|uniref:Uncharacterized protein n=1 Tax=Datura stramonium TaxID=4076 RepID=A0ABS8TR48_DATST|nr:hypothetical protein [Datura stramonium]